MVEVAAEVVMQEVMVGIMDLEVMVTTMVMVLVTAVEEVMVVVVVVVVDQGMETKVGDMMVIMKGDILVVTMVMVGTIMILEITVDNSKLWTYEGGQFWWKKLRHSLWW